MDDRHNHQDYYKGWHSNNHHDWIWFWQTDDDTWRLFDILDTMEIRKADAAGKTTVSLHDGRYQLHLSKLIQINQVTGFQRTISKALTSTIWLWKDYDESDKSGNCVYWNVYEENEADRLTEALNHGEDSVILDRGAMVYFIDILNLLQTNIDTGRLREIRRGLPPEYDLIQPIALPESPVSQAGTNSEAWQATSCTPPPPPPSTPIEPPDQYESECDCNCSTHRNIPEPPCSNPLLFDSDSRQVDHAMANHSDTTREELPATFPIFNSLNAKGADERDRDDQQHTAAIEDGDEELTTGSGNIRIDDDKEDLKRATRDKRPEFICRICDRIMRDPTLAWNGETYDRHCIEKWFRENNHDFVTGEDISPDQKRLITNYAFKHLIEAWRDGEYKK